MWETWTEHIWEVANVSLPARYTNFSYKKSELSVNSTLMVHSQPTTMPSDSIPQQGDKPITTRCGRRLCDATVKKEEVSPKNFGTYASVGKRKRKALFYNSVCWWRSASPQPLSICWLMLTVTFAPRIYRFARPRRRLPQAHAWASCTARRRRSRFRLDSIFSVAHGAERRTARPSKPHQQTLPSTVGAAARGFAPRFIGGDMVPSAWLVDRPDKAQCTPVRVFKWRGLQFKYIYGSCSLACRNVKLLNNPDVVGVIFPP